MNVRSFFSAYGLRMWVSAFFLFLYIPIVVLVIFSFNESPTLYQWGGFSTHWYAELFQSAEVWQALRNSLYVASFATFLSVTMSLLLVYFGSNLRRFFPLFYGSLVIPEVVLAVGLLGFFSLFTVMLGFSTLIVGHTLLGLGYAVPIVSSRYDELEKHLTEASLDLGASYVQTFFRIILPLLVPALVAAAILVFVISLDDFMIAFFCAGGTTQTLPLYIFSVVRAGGSPMLNALSTVLLCFGSMLIMLIAALRMRKIFMFGS